MDEVVLPSTRIVPLQKYHQRWACNDYPAQTPDEVYQAIYKEAQQKVNEAARAYGRGGSIAVSVVNDDATADGLELLLQLGNKFHEVKAQKKDVAQKEHEYQEMLLQRQKSELREHLDILGQSVCESVINEWVADQQSSQAPPTPAREQTEEDIQPSNITSHLPFASENCQPTCDQHQAADATTAAQDQLPQQPMQKKRSRSSNSGSSRTRKRARGNNSSGLLTDRVIEFDQVYQNGKAQTKYIIQKFQGHWYIAECRDCNMIFVTGRPLHGARKHLASNRHACNLGVTWEMAVARFGTRVLNCTPERAEDNNRIAQRLSYDRHGRPDGRAYTSRGPVNTTDDESYNRPLTRQVNGTLASHIDPQPGEIYATFWEKEKKFYAVLVLPWDNFYRFFGIPEWDMRLKDTPLLADVDKIPACYDYDQNTGTAEWTKAFKPGGPKASKREYPIIFFDSPCFPGECHYGWAAASDFVPYRPDDDTIPYKPQIEWFLEEYHSHKMNSFGVQVQDPNGDAVSDPSPANEDTNADSMHDRPPSTYHPSPKLQQTGLSIDNSILIPDDDDNDDTNGIFEKALADRTRRSSVQLKEEPAQPDFANTADVPEPQHDIPHPDRSAVPSDEQQPTHTGDQWPVSTEQNNFLDHGIQTGTADLDTMTTQAEKMSNEEYFDMLTRMCESSPDPFDGSEHQQRGNIPITSDVQAGPSSRDKSASAEAFANAKMQAYAEASIAFEKQLASLSSNPKQETSSTYDSQHPSHNSLPISPLPQAKEDKVSQPGNVSTGTLHSLYSHLNKHSTGEGHGRLQRTERSDGGFMWTVAQTSDKDSSGVSQAPSSKRERRQDPQRRISKKERRQQACFLPPRR